MNKAAFWTGVVTRIGIGSLALFFAIVKLIASATSATVFAYEGF